MGNNKTFEYRKVLLCTEKYLFLIKQFLQALLGFTIPESEGSQLLFAFVRKIQQLTRTLLPWLYYYILQLV